MVHRRLKIGRGIQPREHLSKLRSLGRALFEKPYSLALRLRTPGLLLPCILPVLPVVQEQVGEEKEQEEATQHLAFGRCGSSIPRGRDCNDTFYKALPVNHPQTLRFRMLLAPRAPELSALLS